MECGLVLATVGFILPKSGLLSQAEQRKRPLVEGVSLSRIVWSSSCLMALLIAGCTTFQDIDEGLAILHGRPADDLIRIIGFPDKEQVVAGRRLYVWSTSEDVTVFRPVTTVSLGNARISGANGATQTEFEKESTAFVPVVENYNCTIRVQVDRRERIVFHDLDGNAAGCERYAKPIRNTLKSN